ncbi:hypothetical protein BJ138DRAFT_1066149 [Hygrophoropsis aurantiaca]|uniref:Uncharacterized protein n=1 Tax=Hygrophoropsis aurantiaca TaxID=72124 RepID=A0ACB8AA40_9AGAM|nr:hypothetical protein BJ138DRAFT_1066149 [Hygrophoropsis aurantiaca]
MIHFIPLNRPKPASILRQISYRDNIPLLSPALDPQGWHCLPRTKIVGRISGNRHVVVDCTLSLAKPLCYTRGSVLPCHIAMHSQNAQALDILTVPKACKIRLHRIAGIFSRTSQQENKQIVDKFPRTSVFVASAMIWLARDNDDSHTRYLEGEIPLPNDLTPSTILDDFEVSYSVVLLPFEVHGFTPHRPDNDPLSEVSVEIATAYAPGPRPRSYAASAGHFYANRVLTEQFEAAPMKLVQRWAIRR